MNRGPAYGTAAHNQGARPLEVDVPPIQPWVKEPNKLSGLWICSRDVRALVAIAVQTREGEVIENTQAPMLACNDVVDVKRQGVQGGWKVAILTSISGPLADLRDNVAVHELRPSGGFLLLSASRALDCIMARKFPMCR